MKCEKCGFTANPGDQVCINCGAKLSSKNAIMPGLETIEEEKIDKKDTKKLILVFSGIIILLLIIIFMLIWRFL